MARMTKEQKALAARVNRIAQAAVDRIQIPIMQIPKIFSRAAVLAAAIEDDDQLIAEIRSYAMQVAA